MSEPLRRGTKAMRNNPSRLTMFEYGKVYTLAVTCL